MGGTELSREQRQGPTSSRVPWLGKSSQYRAVHRGQLVSLSLVSLSSAPALDLSIQLCAEELEARAKRSPAGGPRARPSRTLPPCPSHQFPGRKHMEIRRKLPASGPAAPPAEAAPASFPRRPGGTKCTPTLRTPTTPSKEPF